MYFLVIIWVCYFYWYLCVIIEAKPFVNISDKTFEQQKICSDSKLRFIYFNKKAFPQLKCIAIEAIVFFILNIIYTIIVCILFAILKNNSLITNLSITYLFLFFIITAATIFIVDYKK